MIYEKKSYVNQTKTSWVRAEKPEVSSLVLKGTELEKVPQVLRRI